MNIKKKNKDIENRIRVMIDMTKHWNCGSGLIVPKSVAKRLEEMGITSGYSVNQKVSI